jgi:hypothetical protein
MHLSSADRTTTLTRPNVDLDVLAREQEPHHVHVTLLRRDYQRQSTVSAQLIRESN